MQLLVKIAESLRNPRLNFTARNSPTALDFTGLQADFRTLYLQFCFHVNSQSISLRLRFDDVYRDFSSHVGCIYVLLR